MRLPLNHRPKVWIRFGRFTFLFLLSPYLVLLLSSSLHSSFLSLSLHSCLSFIPPPPLPPFSFIFHLFSSLSDHSALPLSLHPPFPSPSPPSIPPTLRPSYPAAPPEKKKRSKSRSRSRSRSRWVGQSSEVNSSTRPLHSDTRTMLHTQGDSVFSDHHIESARLKNLPTVQTLHMYINLDCQ